MKGRRPQRSLRQIDGGLAGVPKPPEKLTGAALAEWNRAARFLVDEDLFHNGIAGTLAIFCNLVAEISEDQAILKKEGRTIKTAMGQPRPHPLIGIVKSRQELVARLASDLGLTPVRGRKPAPPPEPDDAPAGLDI